MAKRQANREIMIQGYISCIWGDYKVKEELYNNQQTAVDLFTFAMSKTKKDPYLENVRHIMEAKLNTSIEVTKNKITISYNGNDNLNDILEKLGCLEEHQSVVMTDFFVNI